MSASLGADIAASIDGGVCFTPGCQKCNELQMRYDALEGSARRNADLEVELQARATATSERCLVERDRFRAHGKEISELRSELAQATKQLSAQQRRFAGSGHRIAGATAGSPRSSLASPSTLALYELRDSDLRSTEGKALEEAEKGVNTATVQVAFAERARDAEAEEALRLVRLVKTTPLLSSSSGTMSHEIAAACEAVLAACGRTGGSRVALASIASPSVENGDIKPNRRISPLRST